MVKQFVTFRPQNLSNVILHEVGSGSGSRWSIRQVSGSCKCGGSKDARPRLRLIRDSHRWRKTKFHEYSPSKSNLFDFPCQILIFFVLDAIPRIPGEPRDHRWAGAGRRGRRRFRGSLFRVRGWTGRKLKKSIQFPFHDVFSSFSRRYSQISSHFQHFSK